MDRQAARITENQAYKIDEIWSGINESIASEKQYSESCEAASKLLREVVESPAFQSLSDREREYMERIYREGRVQGSYRIQRVREVHAKLLSGEGNG